MMAGRGGRGRRGGMGGRGRGRGRGRGSDSGEERRSPQRRSPPPFNPRFGKVRAEDGNEDNNDRELGEPKYMN